MTPIVFCASLVPCASETSELVKTCPILKRSRWRFLVMPYAILVAR